MTDRKGYIYKLTSPSGKHYIGKTIQEPFRRWSKHHTKVLNEDDDNQCRALGNAIRKYGWDNFTREILIECEEWELNDLEIALIEEYNSLVPNGYNLTKGGDGPGIMSEETKDKMSQVATFTSKRIYERKDPGLNLPRCIQKWKNSYRVEMSVNRKRICKVFNIAKYGDAEALQMAKDFVVQMRPEFVDIINQ